MDSELCFQMGNDETAKWEFAGKTYCVHVQVDDGAENPREWDNPDVMACWHPRYKLGDEVLDKRPEDFWRRLVRENVPGVDVDDLEMWKCQELMRPHAEWLDLWLYDHGGTTMSCSRGGNPFHCGWDSGQVGWIVMLRDDASGETEEEWREWADRVMESDVDFYDKYLRGEVYGFSLLENVGEEGDDPEWEEVDSCWGFYGADMFQSGMAYHLSGFEEAVAEGRVETGAARKVLSWDYGAE